MEKKYTNVLKPSSQFPMCGNCFRMDTYRGCSFGCSYCFANNRGGNNPHNFCVVDMDYVRRQFYSAIIKSDTNTIRKELLNRYVPLHLGGLSDPFQKQEWKIGASYEFLKLSSEYKYPVNISTKTSYLPDKYWDVLDPNIHTFSISLMGLSDDYIRTWEYHTPLASERIDFVKQLKQKGFWTSIRIQPIIDIDEVLNLIKATEEYVDFYTIEHLKLPLDNRHMFNLLRDKIKNPQTFVAKGREYEFSTEVKLKNISLIKEATKVPIGVGDNDLHTLSDSLNCCGIDKMPKSFNNWLKYNSMYIKMTGDRSQWKPSRNCNECLNGSMVVDGFSRWEQYVERYYLKTYGSDSQLSLF